MHDRTRIVKLVHQVVTSCKNLEEKMDKIIDHHKQQVPQTQSFTKDRWLRASEAGRIINQDRKTIVKYGDDGLVERRSSILPFSINNS
ncbi:hypothetical protein [Desertivirga brevis]|uniref:hypothetical protein n=1 Tax=Desertivirga brevis TaxID=2810310 RepID=UPI001A96EF4A|nr:hypothetical protein [Pedobacter sp. SYSU D00873]